MASIKTNKGRENLAKAHAGAAALPAVTTVVIGSGGVDANGNPKALTGAETALFTQVASKAATITYPTAYTARYTIKIDADLDALVGTNINEAGLVDSAGSLVAMKTFTNKGLETGTILEFDYDAEF